MGVIELGENNHPARTVLHGSGVYTVEAGKTLKIETSPNGEDILEEEVPAGKVWSAHITINIDETDA